MSLKHFPSKGDKVNDIRRRPNANGFVVRILYTDDGPEEVLVKYDDGVEFYDFDDFRYTWTNTLGGVFILQP